MVLIALGCSWYNTGKLVSIEKTILAFVEYSISPELYVGLNLMVGTGSPGSNLLVEFIENRIYPVHCWVHYSANTGLTLQPPGGNTLP